MGHEVNFLDEIIAERTKQNPDFPRLVEAALQRRKAMRAQGKDPNDDTDVRNENEASIPASETAVVPD